MSLLAILLLSLITFCQGEERSLQYDVMSVCDTVYGTTLTTSLMTTGLMSCCSLCTNDGMCRSTLYSEEAGTCRTNADILVSPIFECIGAETLLYASLLESSSASGTSSIRSACTDNADCGVTGQSECRNGKCQCLVGLSHDPSTDSCVYECQEYGTTFQEDLDHYLNGYQSKSFPTFDPVVCMDACAAEQTFECRTAELNKNSGTCYLSVDTAATQPQAYSASSTYNLYQRDCLS